MPLQFPQFTRVVSVLIACAISLCAHALEVTAAPLAATEPTRVANVIATALSGSSGAFAVAPAEQGSLFVVVRHPRARAVQLRTPAGQVLTTENIWRVGHWYADDQVDVVTIDAPATGVWQVLAGELRFCTMPLGRSHRPLDSTIHSDSASSPAGPRLARQPLIPSVCGAV